LGWIATGLAKEKKIKKGKDEVEKKAGRKWKWRVRRDSGQPKVDEERSRCDDACGL
jgi:hypothetical protein